MSETFRTYRAREIAKIIHREVLKPCLPFPNSDIDAFVSHIAEILLRDESQIYFQPVVEHDKPAPDAHTVCKKKIKKCPPHDYTVNQFGDTECIKCGDIYPNAE